MISVAVRQRSCGKVMFSQVLSTTGGGSTSGPMSLPEVGISSTRSLPGVSMSKGWVLAPQTRTLGGGYSYLSTFKTEQYKHYGYSAVNHQDLLYQTVSTEHP